ncbi:MAG: head-tail connector protein [Rhodospirillales bacterium]|nr:head-tail connector protein [Rhodospirillales bacterium]
MTSSRLDPRGILERYARARQRRATWEAHWQECYDFALPQRDSIIRRGRPGEKRTEKLFDATAPDAVDQLAASLMAQLTPPWSTWFGFCAGPDADPALRRVLAPDLERMSRIVQAHFDRSNFVVELHQCYLDLVTAGTACLMFEEAGTGEESAFRFTAVPLSQVVLEEGASGRLDTTFRRSQLSPAHVLARFPDARDAEHLADLVREKSDASLNVVEAVVPDGRGYAYLAVAENGQAPDGKVMVLGEGRFLSSPFISFRWSKAPGEAYGRSPVMKALPDIKTANKVVELVLKNASIAVTGIWQVDDDGVINPANIKLVPGAVIPKAIGSAGLTPLEAPGRFDVSELVLDQVHARIRKAMLVDQLGPVNGPRMTATEVLARAAEMARLLGATYGRLQSELLAPLVVRARMILARRGEIPDLPLDHRMVALEHRSPQARHQAQQSVQNTMLWLDTVRALGTEAMLAVDQTAAARWLAQALGVPGELVREPGEGLSLSETAISSPSDAHVASAGGWR